MATSLDTVLANTAIPLHPFILIQHSLSAPAAPIVREILARAATRGTPQLIVSLLHPPDVYLPSWQSRGVRSLDLSRSVPGYSSGSSSADNDDEVERRIVKACQGLEPGTQIFLDAPDILADDYSLAIAVRVVRSLLTAVKASKSPARLIVASPHDHHITEHLIPATLSPSLALLTPYHPRVIEHLAKSYLVQADESPRFWQLLETSRQRGLGDSLALRAAPGIEVAPATECAVQILLRKPTGGAKALSRSLDGFKKGDTAWSAVPLSEVVDTQPVSAPGTVETSTRPTTHADLDLSFNLNLTDAQRVARGAVPLPYAHEGEGADLGMGMDWEEDEEDDEI